MDDVEDFLAHYGVKGMKWGVRKKTATRGKKPGTRAYDVTKMSNKDLKKVISRMKLEQEYSTLNKKTQSEGKKYALDLLKGNGKQLSGAVVGGVGTFFVQRALKSRFSG